MAAIKRFRVVFGLAAVLLAGGCKSMTPGQLSLVQPYSDQKLAGNVYLLRGFIGIWSYGVDHLGDRIREAGIRASVYQEDQWRKLAETIIAKYKDVPDHEPLILIGHSYGADDAVRVAKHLEEAKIQVDVVITLDPVTPPKVPGNVKLCYNIYQSNTLDGLPFFRGVPLTPELEDGKNVQNVNIRKDRRDLLESGTDHFNIEKNVRIHEEVVRQLQAVCPPRYAWTARKSVLPPTPVMRSLPERAEPQRLGSTGAAVPATP
jgi:pimeloyl-ACP methyl ester carboxylesterase